MTLLKYSTCDERDGQDAPVVPSAIPMQGYWGYSG